MDTDDELVSTVSDDTVQDQWDTLQLKFQKAEMPKDQDSTDTDDELVSTVSDDTVQDQWDTLQLKFQKAEMPKDQDSTDTDDELVSLVSDDSETSVAEHGKSDNIVDGYVLLCFGDHFVWQSNNDELKLVNGEEYISQDGMDTDEISIPSFGTSQETYC
eukprot:TRINITY_DN904_c0_g1_i7.p1 TRINITY_DN904_c0_g1~~TRINITY_DN904_c0_g1_i7.p1  ORF type:complete len:159 (+),score=30.10 TRINITY_DN904_c0_g1_i7:158-634(+)